MKNILEYYKNYKKYMKSTNKYNNKKSYGIFLHRLHRQIAAFLKFKKHDQRDY